MCQRCVEAFDELWPELSEEDRMYFLWNCTAFPIGNNTRERLEHFLAACGKDFQAILDLNDEEFQEVLAEAAKSLTPEERGEIPALDGREGSSDA